MVAAVFILAVGAVAAVMWVVRLIGSRRRRRWGRRCGRGCFANSDGRISLDNDSDSAREASIGNPTDGQIRILRAANVSPLPMPGMIALANI